VSAEHSPIPPEAVRVIDASSERANLWHDSFPSSAGIVFWPHEGDPPLRGDTTFGTANVIHYTQPEPGRISYTLPAGMEHSFAQALLVAAAPKLGLRNELAREEWGTLIRRRPGTPPDYELRRNAVEAYKKHRSAGMLKKDAEKAAAAEVFASPSFVRKAVRRLGAD
jgi:hypothetical protein